MEIMKVNGIEKVIKFENLYISSQPSEKSFDWIIDNSIDHIINLRDKDELDFTFEIEACSRNDISYDQFPITSNGKYILENLEKLNKLISDKDKTYLIHCGTANRVLAWLLTYLPVHREMSFNDSEKFVANLGFKGSDLLEQAKKLLIV